MIPVFEPEILKEDISNVVKTLSRGELSGNFSSMITKFESEFANYSGCKYGIAVSSGTTALHLAIAILNLKKNSEIIISSCTNIATALACYHNKCIPIPVDSNIDTWNLDESEIEKLITKKTKAIIAVHFLGNPANMKVINKIAKKYKLVVVEDAAEAHGSTIQSRKVGSFSDIACFSFYANKTITSGEGGMLVTNNKKYERLLKLYRNVGYSKKRFIHNVAAYNFRYTAMQAAFCYSQFKRINKIIKRKIEIAETYRHYLRDLEEISFQKSPINFKNTYWMIGILNLSKKINKKIISKKLNKHGIDTRSFFLSILKQPCFKEIYKNKDLKTPRSDYLWNNGLYLPSSLNLKKNQIKYICNKIKSIY
jgi:perosamine synthetase